MEITVEEFLNIPLLKGSEIVAGKAGSHRVIKSLSLMDSIYGYVYLDRDMLAVTSGYVLASEADKISETIAQMARRGLAGITLKAKYFHYQLPESMLKTADEWNFPIIQLADNEMQFYKLFEYFNIHVYSRKLAEFLRLDTVSAVLINAINTKGPIQLAKQLHEWTGKTVSVVLKKSILCYPPQTQSSELNVLLSGNNFLKFCQPNTEKNEVLCLRSSYVAASGINFYYNLNSKGSVWLDEMNIACDDNDIAMLRVVKSACEIGSRQIIAYEQDEMQLRMEFVEDVLSGKLRSIHDAALRTRRLNWRIPEKVQILLIQSHFPAELTQQVELVIQKFLSEWNLNIVECFYKGRFVLFLPSDLDNSEQFISSLYKKLNDQWPREEFGFFTGRLSDFHNARTSYLQACLAQQVTTMKGLEASHYCTFDEIGIFRLCGSESPNELYLLCRDLLEPLMKSNVDPEINLLKTLRCFFRCRCNYSRTSQELYIHPNTVRYRLSVVEKLCGVNLEDYDDALNLQVALQVLPVFFPNYLE